jgi:cardiolipin synthase C
MAMVRRFLILALATLIVACGSLPPRGEVPASHAFTNTADTALARVAASSRPGDAPPSGFQLLSEGDFAYDARVALARHAERSLDLQYYQVGRDVAGRAMLRELRDAAQRGVRVRLLVDDFHAGDLDDLLAGLAAYPNAQVRLFNPLPLRHGTALFRLALSRGELQLYNHRMHNKLFVADNAVAIYGGRNLADEYFMRNLEANFIDLDVLSIGQVVGELSSAFDLYWNSELSWPVQAVLGNSDTAQAQRRFDQAVADARVDPPERPVDQLGHTTIESQLQKGRLLLSYARAQVNADPPEKASTLQPITEPTLAMHGLLTAIGDTRDELVLVSPYFVPEAKVGLPMLRAARKNGIHILLFTNSLGSTDEPVVHAAYAARRVELLRIGVEVYEISPPQARRFRRFGDFGRSIPRLHAKVAIVDRERLLVGSANLDPRSAVNNTELSVVIDSPSLAGELTGLMISDNFSSVYKLRLMPDGQTIEWIHAAEQGEPSTTTKEPGSGWWLSLKLWLESLLLDERDL